MPLAIPTSYLNLGKPHFFGDAVPAEFSARFTPVICRVPAAHVGLLCGTVFAVLTTLMADGQPQSSLVWCDYDGADLVVYESHWGNTAEIARAIAAGLGPDAQALTTDAATGEALAGVDLIVAGAPLLGFALPTQSMLDNIAAGADKDPVPPDLAHPSMRAWLAALPPGHGRAAAFETRIWWSPGSAAKAILQRLAELGYPALGDVERFVVKGKYGPLADGEVARARTWGMGLAQAMRELHQAELHG